VAEGKKRTSGSGNQHSERITPKTIYLLFGYISSWGTPDTGALVSLRVGRERVIDLAQLGNLTQMGNLTQVAAPGISFSRRIGLSNRRKLQLPKCIDCRVGSKTAASKS
jgi:hypothetical protein